MQGTNDAASGAGGVQAGSESAGLLTSPTSDSERFLADLKTFVADAEVLLGQARTLSGAGALAAREEFERRLSQARRGYAAAREVAVDRAQDYMDRTEAYVRNEPWKAIGVAAIAGAIVGVLLARR
jgi:ElaB/YqjD/DUF883 family membrane-anchored ribosome-binding protein